MWVDFFGNNYICRMIKNKFLAFLLCSAFLFAA